MILLRVIGGLLSDSLCSLCSPVVSSLPVRPQLQRNPESRRHSYTHACITLTILLLGVDAQAASAGDIPLSYREVAREYGLPPALLYATALTASGRSMSDRGVRPWPWTLNIGARRHYYLTQASAHRALQAQIARGVDARIGLMGLSWDRYRAEAPDPWAALDPHTNLRLAAARLAPHLAHRGYFKRARRPVSGELDQLIAELAPRHALDAKLVREVVAQESAYDARAQSPKGAQGLMQLMPATAARFGVEDPWNPKSNLVGGMRFLAWLLTYYRGDLARVLAAYNAGEATVDRYGGIPPYAETRAYVAQILGRYGRSTHPYRIALAEASS
ncbi:MAG: lytic transglycosylase domain-containing protein [Gammaproteobacteria bacterium]